MTLDDMWSLRSVRDLRISPDGQTVAYVVGHVDEEHNRAHSAIWLADLCSGQARQLTNGATRDEQPRWSPDGSFLAFVSVRHENIRQIFVIPTGGGEARRLTSTAHGAHSPVWSPDGLSICFASDLPSGRQQVPQETAWLEAHPLADGAGRSQRRQSTLFSRVDGRGYIDRRTHLFVMPVAPGGEARQITEGDHDHLQAAWSGDGDLIAFVANRGEDAEHSFASDIWALDVTTGAVTCLTGGDLAVAYPTWSPDGQMLAFYAALDSTKNGYHDTHLWCVSRAGGNQRDLSACLDRPYRFIQPDYLFPPSQPIAWSPDSAAVYFLTVDRGDCGVYVATMETGQVERVSHSEAAVVGVQCAADARTLAVLAATPTRPYDVFTVPASGGPLTPLGTTNASVLATRSVISPEHIVYRGAEGWHIEGWLYVPARSSRDRHPLIVHVHGGPHGAFGHTFYLQAQTLAGAGYASLYLNPRGSLGYGEAFSAAADWGDKDFLDIMAGVETVLTRDDIDPDRVGITGLSYGGFMTNWALGHTDRFAAGVSINGMTLGGLAIAVGDRVAGFAPAALGTRVATAAHAVTPIPPETSFAAAATVPVAFVTAIYALGTLAKLAAGEHVLIHAAGGGTAAVGPLVVPRSVDERVLEQVEVCPDRGEVGVRTETAPVLYVAQMGHE